jgi:hypothetical protein
MFDKETIKKLVETAQVLSEPIDFEALIKEGVLIKRGSSYYAPNIHALPKNVSERIRERAQTKYGVRVTFYKERKGLKKIANQFSGYLKK